jgi:ATP-binding cassette subfamily B protein
MSKTPLKQLLSYTGMYKGTMIAALIISSLSGICLLSPYVSAFIVLEHVLQNAGSLSGINGEVVTWWALAGITGQVTGMALMYFGGMAGHVAAFNTLYRIRLQIAQHIGHLPLGFLNTNATGKLNKIIELDVEKIELFIAHQLPDLINTTITLAALVGAMFVLDWRLALASLIPLIAGFSVQFSMMMGSKAQAALKKGYTALEDISASSTQYVRGMPSIKVFGQTVHSFKDYRQSILRFRDFYVQYADAFQNRIAAFMTIAISLATFIVPVGLFFFLGDSTDIAFATVLVFFLILTPGLSTPALKLNMFSEVVNTVLESVRRIDGIMCQEALPDVGRDATLDAVRDATLDAVRDVGTSDGDGQATGVGGSLASASHAAPATQTGPASAPHTITFQNVGFRYSPDAPQVLDNISFTAEQGQITALVGPSGSGKSTLAQLLLRFWDLEQGAIRVGGTNIRALPVSQLMDMVAFVFQDTYLFNVSIMQNIRVGRPAATDDMVFSAAKAAQIHDFITSLPQGYDTVLGQEGVHLSGGEEQRVSVARAILKNAPILVLDEATAYADPENEYNMQQAINRLIQDKTVIIVAHRLTTIQDANKIVLLEAGRVKAAGTHAELLSNSDLYKSMWEAYHEASEWRIDLKGGAA